VNGSASGDARVSMAPPEHRLDPRARTLWQLDGILTAGPVLLVALGATWLILWLEWPRLLALLVPAGALLLALLLVLVLPVLRWHYWRYAIGDEEIDLQHGIVTITRTLVPVARIQHVDTQRGPLQRLFGLASVVLYTAAGSVEIPALAVDDAMALRDRIAGLAGRQTDYL
jgi:uncharacterized protein